jgi:transcriptional regulator with XRE-family HTH domain
MILKELRISRNISQEQLAQMSGLNVRTIQRIESGHNASLESLKCLASVLKVEVSTLTQEKFMIDKNSANWQNHPLWLKWWFFFNYASFRPSRKATTRAIIISHISGFMFCALGIVIQDALIGGLALLLVAYFFTLLGWQGDQYGVWYDAKEIQST